MKKEELEKGNKLQKEIADQELRLKTAARLLELYDDESSGIHYCSAVLAINNSERRNSINSNLNISNNAAKAALAEECSIAREQIESLKKEFEELGKCQTPAKNSSSEDKSLSFWPTSAQIEENRKNIIETWMRTAISGKLPKDPVRYLTKGLYEELFPFNMAE